MTERYVHLVTAGYEPQVPGRLPTRAHWCCSRGPAAQRTARRLTDRQVEVVSGLDDPARSGTRVRELLRAHPSGDLVLVGDDTALSVVASELTRSEVVLPLPEVVTVRLESSTQPGPLALRVVLIAAVVLSLLDVGQWLVTGRPGYVVGPALVVAGLVAAPRQTRDIGISLVGVVLLASFLDLGWLNFIPRLRQ